MPRPLRPFTILEDSTIIEMRANGASIVQIARTLQRSGRHISQRISYIGNDPRAEWLKLGIPIKPFTPEEDAQITAMRADNTPITKIAAALHRDYRQISKRLRQLHLPTHHPQNSKYHPQNCPRCGILYTATGHPPTPHNRRCVMCQQELNNRRK